MASSRHSGWAGLAGVLLASWIGLPSAASAQQSAPSPAPCRVEPQPLPCGAVTPTGGASSGTPKSNADKFPFPGEGSGAGDKTSAPVPASDNTTAPAPGAAGDAVPGVKKSSNSSDEFPFPEPDSAGAKAPGATNKNAAGEFPFPEDDSKSGADGGSSSSSSSSSSSDDAAAPAAAADKSSDGVTDPGQPQGRHLLHRVNPIGTKLQTPEEREAEDLDIAHYYSQTGDLKGAYLRSQDAVKTAPDDPDAHFALAEAALKLNKRDEAIAEYTACLKLDPIDKEAKAARKELARLKP